MPYAACHPLDKKVRYVCATLPIVDVLVAARGASVTLALVDGHLVAEATKAPEVPLALVAQLRTVRSDLVSLLALREAAQPALAAARPYGASRAEWANAQRGLKQFLADGWADQAMLLGWTAGELFHVPEPERWARVDRCGAGLMLWRTYARPRSQVEVARWTVTDVSAEATSIELVRITLCKQLDGSIEKRPEVYRQRFFRQPGLSRLSIMAEPPPATEAPPKPPRDPFAEEAAIARFKAAAEAVFGSGVVIMEDMK
jgi:hypothetical protein